MARGTGSDCDLEDAADEDEDDDDDAVDEGSVPKDSQEVLLTLLAAGKSESFLLSVSICNSAGESMSMGGDMAPGEVHLLSPSSEAASLRDQRELESSQIELESSVSVKSEATDSVGLVGLTRSSASSSMGSGTGASTCSARTTDLAVNSILCGAGSSRRTLASSTVSSAATEDGEEDDDDEAEECDVELRRGFLLS